MATVRLPVYLYTLQRQGAALGRVYLKAKELDEAGALGPDLALYYYTLRNSTFAMTEALVKAFREQVARVSTSLAASIPEPELGPDLPRTAPTIEAPSRASVEPMRFGLGTPAIAISAEVVTTFILGVAALVAIAGTIYVGATTVTQLIQTYQVTKAYEKLLADRQEYVSRCVSMGGRPEECARSSTVALPTPDQAIAESLEHTGGSGLPWYLSPYLWLAVAGAVGGIYAYREIQGRMSSRLEAPSRGVSGTLPLPRELRGAEESTSRYGLEV